METQDPRMTFVKGEAAPDSWSLRDRGNRRFQEGASHRPAQEDPRAGQWTPAVDVLENADSITLRADLPGVEHEDIDLKVEDGTLLLRGHRKLPANTRPEDMRQAERPCGAFVRSFGLPSNVDPSGIRAVLKNGVLEVTLAKRQESGVRTIRVEVK
jgi:HSP20 family protein